VSDDVWLCWREDVTEALDYQTTARDNRQIDRAIRTASGNVLSQLNRTDVAPTTGTRYFPWPWPEYARSYVLWLDANELLSVTTLTAGGVTIPSTDYFLEPQAYGPPYNRVEIDLASSSAFGGGDTHQRNVAITGDWGLTSDTDSAGTLTTAMTDTTGTSVACSDASLVGVGAVLICGTERMIVTGRSWAATSDTDTLTAVNNDQAVNVTSGAAYSPGEVLLIDQERVKVLDIAGNVLTVKRAWDGTTLAAHTAATIYASRALTVTRGALGSTAATHAINAALTTVRIPGLVRSLTAAEAILQLQREQAGYTTTDRAKTLSAGGGKNNGSGGQSVTTSAIDDLRDAAYSSYGRKARSRVV
jgi:hypothetical protein